MKIGFKLFAEAFDPREIVRQAVLAEQAGFDFVEVSDHFHPWLEGHGHSGFAWSMLAAAADRTTRIGLATGVTCPTMRYHPAVIAQAAATTALLSDGRFTLGVGSGERLNEHVVGAPWPAVAIRQQMLREALEIIRMLWSGGYHSYQGRHLSIDTARVFDLPEVAPTLAVAAGGPGSARMAAELGDALFATEPRGELTDAYAAAGGDGPRYVEVPLAWARTRETALDSARDLFRFGVMGWHVLPELPNPAHFEAASRFVTVEDMADVFGVGPEPEAHLAVARQFAAAGFDHLALINAGPDAEGFFDFFARELAGPLRDLPVSGGGPESDRG